MIITKKCKHCSLIFESRRSNHVYCSASCKTKASYKRNNYKYVSGHYQKQNEFDKVSQGNTGLADTSNGTNKKNDINVSSISNVVIGSAAADTISYGLKKLLAPNTLPATKGDLNLLTEKILGRYHLIKNLPQNSNREFPYFDIENQEVVYLK